MNLIWSNPILNSWNPSTLLPQWDTMLPNYTLPEGQVHIYPPPNETSTIPGIISKGVTHWASRWVVNERGGGQTGIDSFQNDPVYKFKETTDTPRIREMFPSAWPICLQTNPTTQQCTQYSGWWPNGIPTQAQAAIRGQEIDISSRVWIGETLEGDDYVNEGSSMWKGFYGALKIRYEARKAVDNIPYYLCHNYFTRFGHNLYQLRGDSNTDAERQLLYSTTNTTNSSIWKPGLYTPGANLSDTNTIVQGVYIDHPARQSEEVYDALYTMDIARMLGYNTGLYVFNEQEYLPGFASRFALSAGLGAHPYQTVPSGTFERSDKAAVDPNILISLPFLAREFGNMYVNWGTKVKGPNNPRAIFYYDQVHQGKDIWIPDGQSPTSYPGYISPGSEQGRRSVELNAYKNDLVNMGNYNWNVVASPVAGGTFGYCTYRIDGGSWITATSNKSDVVVCAAEKRGFVRYRIKSGQLMMFYWNGYADNLQHSIEIKDPITPTTIHTGIICGNGVHSVRITL